MSPVPHEGPCPEVPAAPAQEPTEPCCYARYTVADRELCPRHGGAPTIERHIHRVEPHYPFWGGREPTGYAGTCSCGWEGKVYPVEQRVYAANEASRHAEYWNSGITPEPTR